MSDDRLRVDEVAAVLGETRHIVRNWLRDFRQYVPVERAANGYNEFPPAAVEKMKLIRHLSRDRGFSTRQIEHFLSSGEEAPPSASPAGVDEIADMKKMLVQLAAAQEQQNELSKAILQRMDERDKQLTQFLTERREAAKELPPPKRSKWMFWKND